jgi:putative transposase
MRVRQSAYLNNRVGQDHRTIKGRVRSMLNFKSMGRAFVILGEVELVHMMRKGQARYACNSDLSLAKKFDSLAA